MEEVTLITALKVRGQRLQKLIWQPVTSKEDSSDNKYYQYGKTTDIGR